MYIKKAKIEDIPKIIEIINYAKSYLKSQNVDQWQNGYPNEETLKSDIQKNEFYILYDKEIIGCMSLSFNGEKTYDVIDGKWLSNTSYGVIHRLAIHPDFKGKNLANLFLKFAEEEALKLNINSIKIDTHQDNISMQNWILNNGFIKCGTIRVADYSMRLAYEKLI